MMGHESAARVDKPDSVNVAPKWFGLAGVLLLFLLLFGTPIVVGALVIRGITLNNICTSDDMRPGNPFAKPCYRPDRINAWGFLKW
jgi:hypothetical protein